MTIQGLITNFSSFHKILYKWDEKLVYLGLQLQYFFVPHLFFFSFSYLPFEKFLIERFLLKVY